MLANKAPNALDDDDNILADEELTLSVAAEEEDMGIELNYNIVDSKRSFGGANIIGIGSLGINDDEEEDIAEEEEVLN